MDQPNIRALFIDFGNVCATFRFGRFLEAFAVRTGVKKEDVEHLLFGGAEDGKSYSPLFADFERGKIGPVSFFHRLTKALSCADRIDYRTFAKLWAGVFITENHSLTELLHEVRVPKYLLSNTNKTAYVHYIAETTIVRVHFPRHDTHVLSYREGSVKPHRHIYDRAILRAQTSFAESLFIDDRIENLEMWEGLGGHGVLYHAGNDTIMELRRNLHVFGLLP